MWAWLIRRPAHIGCSGDLSVRRDRGRGSGEGCADLQPARGDRVDVGAGFIDTDPDLPGATSDPGTHMQHEVPELGDLGILGHPIDGHFGRLL